MILYVTLFIWSFLSATIIPLGVEPYFISLVSSSGQITLPVIVASAGNSLGGLTLLLMGIAGNQWISRHVQKEKKMILEKSTSLFRKYGNPVLLFSWVPFAGDVLVMIVGLSKPDLKTAVIYLTIGKTLRFIVLAYYTARLETWL